jgi:hypothetical protein
MKADPCCRGGGHFVKQWADRQRDLWHALRRRQVRAQRPSPPARAAASWSDSGTRSRGPRRRLGTMCRPQDLLPLAAQSTVAPAYGPASGPIPASQPAAAASGITTVAAGAWPRSPVPGRVARSRGTTGPRTMPRHQLHDRGVLRLTFLRGAPREQWPRQQRKKL